MKVTFKCDNGANILSEKKQVFDTKKDFDLTDEEWMELSDEEKNEYVHDWAMENFSYWYEE